MPLTANPDVPSCLLDGPLQENNLSRSLRSQLRHYFHYKALSKGSRSWHSLLSVLSPSLRAEVATQTSCQWIRNLRYFRKCEEEFLIDLSMQLQPQTYTPKECIIKIGDAPNRLYIVRRGVVACEGMIYCRGGVFATDMLQVSAATHALLGGFAAGRKKL